jgi:DNA topoisomerase VI subunit B
LAYVSASATWVACHQLNCLSSALILQIMEWERKIQLHKEVQLTSRQKENEEESASLTKHVRRLKAKSAKLQKTQKKLQSDLLKAISKREIVEMQVSISVLLLRDAQHSDSIFPELPNGVRE